MTLEVSAGLVFDGFHVVSGSFEVTASEAVRPHELWGQTRNLGGGHRGAGFRSNTVASMRSGEGLLTALPHHWFTAPAMSAWGMTGRRINRTGQLLNQGWPWGEDVAAASARFRA